MRLVIDGNEVNYFNTGSITLKLDSIASVFEFSTYFSPQTKDYQEILKPLQYKDVQIYNSKDNLIFTGTILNHRFISNKGRNLLIISGYSKCGILEDVSIPPSHYPLESTNKSLLDIANHLCGIFGIKVVVASRAKTISNSKIVTKQDKKVVNPKSDLATLNAKSNAVFGRTSASPSETIKDYLAKLATQKNIVLSHNEKGEVLLFQPDYDQLPKYFFTKGNTLEMQLDFNGQAMHSEINIVRQPSDDNAGVSTFDKAHNTLIAKYRPTTKILSSGEDYQIKDAAKNELASELKAITGMVKLQGIFDEIYPGEIVNVHNHYLYCYACNRFMVESVTMNFDPKDDTTTLNLVIPETFTGGTIRNILYNHQDKDFHVEEDLNELNHQYMNDTTIL
jgi:prophage tail gpP-like protein